MTAYQRLSNLTAEANLRVLEAEKSEVKVFLSLVSPEASLGLQMTALLVTFHMIVLLCVFHPHVSVCANLLLKWYQCQIGWSPTHFKLITS